MRLPRRLGHDDTAELVDHLGELRARLIVVLIALAGGFAVGYGFHHQLIDWLNQALPAHRRKPVTFGVAEPFMTSLKVSLYAGFAIALPVILWQIWSFLAPAVRKGVEKSVFGFVAFATLLFGAGIAFGHQVALPAAVHFLTNYDSGIYDIQIRASSYYSFALLSLLAVGIVFELPIFILGLVRFRILTAAKLRRNRRIGYVTMAALAVALPGVDPVTTVFEMVPLMILFEGSIWLAVIFERRWRPELHGALSAAKT
ncbi:MAG: sec-independent protein translocase protein TatC [Gaiellaceae bacterium]|jgi:sec-independent protein translocase protein TatC|nr:sec-independent protein translocase protein TatC [Gaiellaceae bacterium]